MRTVAATAVHAWRPTVAVSRARRRILAWAHASCPARLQTCLRPFGRALGVLARPCAAGVVGGLGADVIAVAAGRFLGSAGDRPFYCLSLGWYLADDVGACHYHSSSRPTPLSP